MTLGRCPLACPTLRLPTCSSLPKSQPASSSCLFLEHNEGVCQHKTKKCNNWSCKTHLFKHTEVVCWFVVVVGFFSKMWNCLCSPFIFQCCPCGGAFPCGISRARIEGQAVHPAAIPEVCAESRWILGSLEAKFGGVGGGQ